jgi:hypothetical protein
MFANFLMGAMVLMLANIFLLANVLMAQAQAEAQVPVTLDRIAVTVDKQIVAESDIIRYLRAAAFLDDKPVDLSGSAKRMAASTLVDQALMMKDAADSHFVLPTAEEVPALLQQVKMHYPSEADFTAALNKYRITEKELGDHLLAGVRAERFTDLRFAPEVEISDAELRAAYDKYVAEWRANHKEPPPSFEDSQDNLTSLLTSQGTLEELDKWLVTARRQSRIEYREAAFQ